MRVLTVLPDFPFPAVTGLHLRMVSNLDLVHRLACFSSLLYFTTEEREPPSVASTSLTELCDEVRHGGRRFPHSNFSPGSLVRRKLDFLVRGALGVPGTIYPFSMSYDQIDACGIIVEEARRIEADFVILPSRFMHYTPRLRERGFSVIIDAADVLSNLSASFLRHYNGRGGKLGLYANYLACRSQERIFLPQCSELWATTDAEAKEFRRIAPGVRVLVVPNSLDEQKISSAQDVAAPIIGFIGTYSYTPNLQAAEFLANEVFPRVLQNCPDATLRIAGGGMPELATARLQKLKNVELLGRVKESGQFIDDCAVLALPVFVRGGVPLKVVEAMAHGKAVVASPELVEGLAVTDGKDVIVRKGAEAFAEAISLLLRDGAKRESVGWAARENFVRHLSLSSVEASIRQKTLLVSETIFKKPGKCPD